MTHINVLHNGGPRPVPHVIQELTVMMDADGARRP